MLGDTYVEMSKAMGRAVRGVSTRVHELDSEVTFILDNHQEVRLQVKKIELLYIKNGEYEAETNTYFDTVKELNVYCRTNFENVLILAQKMKMKISAFSPNFSVTLTATKAFVEEFEDDIMAMKKPADFFETLDDIKRPIFLNLNHYIYSRISK